MQGLRSMGAIGDLKAWLYVVAFRIARRELKRRRSLVALGREPIIRSNPEAASLVQGEGVEELLELLRTITPNQRGAFVLRDVYGYSSRETAQLLGISEVAVRVHLHAARRRLRAQLQEVERQ
jgi:RNA polymerase sigma-70 factor, ECF subfamily